MKSIRYLNRRDDDVICEMPISFSQVALGSEIQVPTLDGKVKLKDPGGYSDREGLQASG